MSQRTLAPTLSSWGASRRGSLPRPRARCSSFPAVSKRLSVRGRLWGSLNREGRRRGTGCSVNGGLATRFVDIRRSELPPVAQASLTLLLILSAYAVLETARRAPFDLVPRARHGARLRRGGD